ncbi:MAG: hypothetical protein K8R36_03715 [Planctomycetales bacterium]|nr:hypothetical protein [Planctomycetales bacterium]
MTLALFVAAAFAGLPLLRLRQVRAAVQGILGSLCVVAGCGAFVAVCSGCCGSIDSTSLFAADTGAKDAAKKLPESSPVEDPSPATVAPSKSSADEPAPVTKLPDGELHTPPKVNPDSIVIPPGRPEWVGKNITVGSEHSIAVCSGLFSTQAEANLELDKVLKAKTDEYITEQLGSTLAPQLVGYDVAKIKRELVQSRNVYQEQIVVPSTGPMQQIHALVEFGPDFRQKITSQWHDWTAYYRLLQTGLIAGGALLFLGTIFSYFRLDNATRGYYTGRLQFMTAAAILAIVGSGALLARWIYWL